jgi:hypothetical protein
LNKYLPETWDIDFLLGKFDVVWQKDCELGFSPLQLARLIGDRFNACDNYRTENPLAIAAPMDFKPVAGKGVIAAIVEKSAKKAISFRKPAKSDLFEVDVSPARSIEGLVHGFFCEKEHRHALASERVSSDPSKFRISTNYSANIFALGSDGALKIDSYGAEVGAWECNRDTPRITMCNGAREPCRPQGFTAGPSRNG